MCVGVSVWLGWSSIRDAGCIVLGSMCVGVSVWLGWSGICVAGWSTTCCASACNTDSTPTQPHRNSNTHRIKNNTTNVVIQQNSHTLLMMDILMSEICWAHKKWNKIASDIKLVFYSSNITMMHSPINIRFTFFQSTTSLFNQLNCLHIYATCSGLYLGHPQASQHKNLHRKIK